MDTAEIQKLTEQELKTAITAVWKKHEESAKKDLAPMLYWLREKLRAQGARNDLTQDKDRGFAFWVEEHLDISRRTADRWCDWYAVKEGLKQDSTSGHLSKSDLDVWEDVLDTHKGKQQIALNFWVSKAMHAQYSTALTTLQKKFACKDKKEALVRGVIYAASVINTRGLRQLPVSERKGKTRVHSATRRRVRPTDGRAKNISRLSPAARSQAKDSRARLQHGGDRSSKAMRAAAGR